MPALLQNLPEQLLSWASADSSARSTTLVSHWVSLMQRIVSFCNAVDPVELCNSSNGNPRNTFDMERQRLFSDINGILEKHFAEVAQMQEENKKLFKVSLSQVSSLALLQHDRAGDHSNQI